jgi:hypothetical protein
MRLTDAQQERYARHLLLDELGGEGQERLLTASVRVRGSGRAVRWAARYLGASGVGTLLLDDAAAAAECRALSPDVRLPDPDAWQRDPDLDLDVNGQDASMQSPAEQGAAAAMRAVRELSRR